MRNVLNVNSYLRLEYGAADREFLVSDNEKKTTLKQLKSLRDMILAGRKTLHIDPSNKSYSYFKTEFKDDITFERDNIIVPDFDNVVVRRMTKKQAS